MADNTRSDTATRPKVASETGAALLLAGGLVAAFSAASCCALPLLLGSLGLAGAWLGSLALLAGPHRPALLAAAVICLVGRWRGAALALPHGRRMRAGCGLRSAKAYCLDYRCPVLRDHPDRAGVRLRVSMRTIPQSTITCPICGTVKAETMRIDACQFFYECTGCGALVRPTPGDCCVFCSYGSVPCPPIQQAGAS